MLTAIVDLPTPPFPEATAITFFTPREHLLVRLQIVRDRRRQLHVEPGVGKRRSDIVGDRRFVRRKRGTERERDADLIVVHLDVVHQPERETMSSPRSGSRTSTSRSPVRPLRSCPEGGSWVE